MPSLKPWNQKVLKAKEIAFIQRCATKMIVAYNRLHRKGKCPIHKKGIPACTYHLNLTTGIMHHYPNGTYIE